jgi:penicillin-binding protein 1C
VKTWARLSLGIAALAVAALGAWIAWPLPDELLSHDRATGLTIVDRHGAPLRTTRAADGAAAAWVPYDRIDPDLITAFVAVEDRRFWDHHGVDARAALRAVWRNARTRRVTSGASTITMQLARLLRPHARSARGKVAQTLWALRLEAHLGKQQILEQYLNRVQLGDGTAGVGAAGVAYFGASPSELSVAQAATLAGIAHAPSRDNPHASPTRARAARALALRRLRRLGLADSETVARARAEPLVVPPRTPPFRAPHFTTRVLAWAGAPSDATTIRTSLDGELQAEVEAEVRHTVDVLRDRGVQHAAAVVLDNASGEVLAWVGSPDFWAEDDGQTDMVVSPRQPGSALKPFLYGLAFDRGLTAATVLPDVPKSFATATGPYAPRDYDRRYRGPVRAREALASSYNVPAVELASRLGAGSLLHTLRLAGFASLARDAEHYGLGLALGNGDVTLVELANGYRSLAAGGVWRPWTWRLGGAPGESRRVLSPLSTAIVLDILQDPEARIPGFGVETPFDFPFPVAVKTGTSRHFTDNWAVGTTAGFTVAVWAGNFSGRPMEGVSGVSGAGPLLHRVVMAAARRVPPGALPSPASLGAERVAVCRLSGLRASDTCARLDEWFAPGTAPTRVDDWERGGLVTLPDEYADWARRGLRTADAGPTLPAAPAGTRLLGTPAPRRALGASHFRILSPLDGDRYAIPVGVESRYATIGLRAAGPGAARVRWIVDGTPYEGERWSLVPGSHEIVATSPRGDSARVRIVVDR